MRREPRTPLVSKGLALLWLFASACAASGTQPHDMSAIQHEASAARDDDDARTHEEKYDPDAIDDPVLGVATGSESAESGRGIGWSKNPTEVHAREAERHRRLAAEHRAASAALRKAEAESCAGIAEASIRTARA